MDEKKHLMRMQKFWICNICKTVEKRNVLQLSQPTLQVIEIDNKRILYPTSGMNNEDFQIDFDTLILIPRTFCRGKFGDIGSYSPHLYNMKEMTHRFIATLYKMRLSKFIQRMTYSELFNGNMLEGGGKRLNSVSRIYDDSCIRGSEMWLNKRRRGIYSMFEQFGRIALSFSIDIDVNNPETIATSLVCSGQILSLELVGNISNEFRTKYFRHNHDNSIECGNNCQKTEISLQNMQLQFQYIPIFIANLHQKMSRLTEDFIKNVNYANFCEDYFIGVDFYLNGGARIHGAAWTQYCSQLNSELSSSTFSGAPVDKDAFMMPFETSILSTAKKNNIRSILNCSEEEADALHCIAVKYQLDHNMPDMEVSFPSFETVLRGIPEIEAAQNIISSKLFLSKCKQNLLQMSLEERNRMETDEWLDYLRTKSKFTLLEENIMEIGYEAECIQFYIDTKLDNYITKGVMNFIDR